VLKLCLGIARLHRDLDAATIFIAPEKMRAQGLSLKLHCALLLPALPELLTALSASGLLVVGVPISSALRNLALAILELLPLTSARRSQYGMVD
jgi:hypothetical protein